MTKYIRKQDGVFFDPKAGRMVEHHGYSKRIFWSRQMLDDLRRDYPYTLNEDLAGYFGVSARTIIRKARELGLEKDPEWLSEIWNERRLLARVKAKRLGNPGCFKKGQHANPATEFKPGHQMTEEEKVKQSAGMRRWALHHPSKVREKARKVSMWAASNPDLVKERNRKVSETKRKVAVCGDMEV